jgi:hypothetical protein
MTRLSLHFGLSTLVCLSIVHVVLWALGGARAPASAAAASFAHAVSVLLLPRSVDRARTLPRNGRLVLLYISLRQYPCVPCAYISHHLVVLSHGLFFICKVSMQCTY